MSTGEDNDFVKAVDNLLHNLGAKFSKVSAELFAKSMGSYRRSNFDVVKSFTVDEMSQRLDAMEAAIKAGNDPENGET